MQRAAACLSLALLSLPGSMVAQSPDIDPSALVTDAEIEQIIGYAITPREPSIDTTNGVTFLSCSSDDVHVNVEVWDLAADATEMFELGTEHPEIPGIGDRARNTQPLGEISILSGRYVLSVDLYGKLDGADELRAATEIARIVVGRLP